MPLPLCPTCGRDPTRAHGRIHLCFNRDVAVRGPQCPVCGKSPPGSAVEGCLASVLAAYGQVRWVGAYLSPHHRPNPFREITRLTNPAPAAGPPMAFLVLTEAPPDLDDWWPDALVGDLMACVFTRDEGEIAAMKGRVVAAAPWTPALHAAEVAADPSYAPIYGGTRARRAGLIVWIDQRETVQIPVSADTAWFHRGQTQGRHALRPFTKPLNWL